MWTLVRLFSGRVGGVTGPHQPFALTEQEVAEDISELCTQLCTARQASGLSVRAAAAAASVAPYTVTRIEDGTVAPSWATFVKLANATGHVLGVRHLLLDWGETSSKEPVVAPGWWPNLRRWKNSDGSDRAMWLQLRAVGSELWWARQWGHYGQTTEAEAARQVGMSRTTVRAIERMTGNPLLSSVTRLAFLTGRQVELRPAGGPRPITEWEAGRAALEGRKP